IVRYFNQSSERIFLRTKAILGRKVQQCHPQKSLPLVKGMLDEFRKVEVAKDITEMKKIEGEKRLL
ncbi:PAS domain-containing protein, partial [bacterium]|nr:PAS domain-containing protein [bacterium]